MTDEHAPRRPASLTRLFLVFNRMSLQGFGGVMAVAQHTLVERERWLGREAFVELLALAQLLPGPNVVNLSLMFGDRFFGLRGALAAAGGVIAVPLVIVIALAATYGAFADVPAVAGALRGMGAVAAGLVIATAFKLLPVLTRSALGRGAAWLFVGVTFIAVGLLRWPLIGVLLGLGALSVCLGWRRLGP